MREMMIYEFEELKTEEAKALAIREVIESDYFGGELSREIKDTFKSKLSMLGVEDLEIEFSLSYSQGDGVAFYGYIDNAHIWNWVDESALNDDEVKLLSLCSMGKANLDVRIERNHWGYRYAHWNCMEVTIPFYEGDNLPFNDERMEELMLGLESKIKDIVQLKSRALESLGYELIEEFESEENIARLLEEHFVEFDEEGYLIS